MTDKIYCAGSNFRPIKVRPYDLTGTGSKRLGLCHKCGRVLKPRKDGTLRRHQVKGRTTATIDKTMEILWESAGQKQITINVPVEYSPTYILVIERDGEVGFSSVVKATYAGVLLDGSGREVEELGEYDGALGELLRDAGRLIRDSRGL